MNAPRHLTDEEVASVIESVARHAPVIIGGQALNILALRYLPRHPQLQEFGPYTSKDIDFLARDRAAADDLAAQWGGELQEPGLDDHTPTLAVVFFEVNGAKIQIDFMRFVLGADADRIWQRALTLSILSAVNETRFEIRLLHPVDCLASRIVNLDQLQRSDDTSLRQAFAAVEIACCFIDELLNNGHHREALDCLTDIRFLALQHGISGDHYHTHGIDLLAVLRAFVSDERLDARWRERRLSPWIAQIEQKRRGYLERQTQRKKTLS